MAGNPRPSPEEVLSWMEETGATQAQAAERFGVTTRTIRNWKKANRKTGKPETGNRKAENRKSGRPGGGSKKKAQPKAEGKKKAGRKSPSIPPDGQKARRRSVQEILDADDFDDWLLRRMKTGIVLRVNHLAVKDSLKQQEQQKVATSLAIMVDKHDKLRRTLSQREQETTDLTATNRVMEALQLGANELAAGSDRGPDEGPAEHEGAPGAEPEGGLRVAQ